MPDGGDAAGKDRGMMSPRRERPRRSCPLLDKLAQRRRPGAFRLESGKSSTHGKPTRAGWENGYISIPAQCQIPPRRHARNDV